MIYTICHKQSHWLRPMHLGKSTILEAIIGAHDLVVPYHQEQYPFRENWKGYTVPTWPSHLRKPVRFGKKQASISIQVEPNDLERAFLKRLGTVEEIGEAEFVIEDGRYVKESSVNEAIRKLFEFHVRQGGSCLQTQGHYEQVK